MRSQIGPTSPILIHPARSPSPSPELKPAPPTSPSPDRRTMTAGTLQPTTPRRRVFAMTASSTSAADGSNESIELGRRDSVDNASERNSVGPLDLSADVNTLGEGANGGVGNVVGGVGAVDLERGLMDDADGVFLNQDFGGGFDNDEGEKSGSFSLLFTLPRVPS